MRKTLVVGLVLAAGVVALAGFARGWHHRHDPEQMAAFVTARIDEALDEVNATPEQRDRIHAVKDRLLARAKELHATRGADRASFLDAWKADAPDPGPLHALVDQRADAMRAFAHEAVDAGLEVHGILTPGQRAKLAERFAQRHGDAAR